MFDKSLIEALSEPDFDEEEVKNMVDEIRKMSIERVKHIARDECRLTISEESFLLSIIPLFGFVFASSIPANTLLLDFLIVSSKLRKKIITARVCMIYIARFYA